MSHLAVVDGPVSTYDGGTYNWFCLDMDCTAEGVRFDTCEDAVVDASDAGHRAVGLTGPGRRTPGVENGEAGDAR